MHKESISEKQGMAIISMFIMGSALILSTASKAKQDLWLAFIVAILVSLPIVFVHSRFLVLYPGKDLYAINEEIFGRFFGKVISLIYILFSFILGGLVLRAFGDFISSVLPETPGIVPMIFIGILCIWVLKEGIETLGRFGEIFVAIMILMILITTFSLIPEMDIDNFSPILYKGFKPIIEGGFQALIFPFTQIVLFTTIFSSTSIKGSVYKVYFGGLFLGAIPLYIASVTNIAVIGADIASSTYFPSYTSAMLVTIGNMVEGVEIIIALSFIVGGFVKVSICLFSTCKGVAKIFGLKDYRFIVTTIGLLIINLSYFIHDSLMEKSRFASETYSFYAFPFQIVLPIIILIIAEIKNKIVNK